MPLYMRPAYCCRSVFNHKLVQSSKHVVQPRYNQSAINKHINFDYGGVCTSLSHRFPSYPKKSIHATHLFETKLIIDTKTNHGSHYPASISDINVYLQHDVI